MEDLGSIYVGNIIFIIPAGYNIWTITNGNGFNASHKRHPDGGLTSISVALFSDFNNETVYVINFINSFIILKVITEFYYISLSINVTKVISFP